MEPRNSSTHPIRVDHVEVDAPGTLGMTLAPGKHQAQASSGAWERDLGADLQRLVDDHGAQMLVTLLEPAEAEALNIAHIGAEARARGMTWKTLSIPDGGVCDDWRAWMALVSEVRATLLHGTRVVVHCKGGLGRTGTLVASVLTTLGVDPHEAMVQVRRARAGAIEHGAQERAVERSAKGWSASQHQKVHGCLLGGAIGDALGAPIEFDSWEGIRRRSGEGGLRFMARAYGREGAITDDTQMTLFTAEGLLRAVAGGTSLTGLAALGALERAYLRWYWTQQGAPREDQAAICDGWLFAQRGLHRSRAPGNTCLSALAWRAALEQGAARSLDAVLNDSKGCGGVMRVAPIGLLSSAPYDLACAAAALTHGHPAGAHASGVFAEIIAELIEGASLPVAVHRVWARRRSEVHHDVRVRVDAALDLAREDTPPSVAQVERLGGGWVAEEALAIALYCALVEPDVEEALILSVNHSGDSDSTGAIVGNLLGAAYGASALPALWREMVEARYILDAVADAVVGARNGDEVDVARFPSN